MAASSHISPASFQIPDGLCLMDLLVQSDSESKPFRLMGWDNLKQNAPDGPLNIPKMMQEIEQEFLNNGKDFIDNIDALFKRLTETIRPAFEKTQLPGEEFKTTEVHLTALQARLQKRYEDKPLQTIWNKKLVPIFRQQGAFQDVAPPDRIQDIRAWLNDPENHPMIRQVTELNCERLKLKALPSEIGLFIGLQSLNLSHNQLSSLPDSFGNLQALTELALRNNQLSYLPESIGNLQALTWLDLHNNQLSYLPDSFGNLSALTSLNLSENQLSSLPDSFGNLQALTRLDLNDNPWMFVSDKEPYKIADYRTYLARLEPLKKYTPQSPLATLFHAIIFNKPAEAIQQAYALLPPEMQQQIAALAGQDPNSSRLTINSSATSSSAASSSSGPSPSQDSLFTDMGLFARSVRKATYELYDSLEPEHKKLVHSHIWDLAGRPETTDPLQWGEHHAFDHVLRFTDALERATQN